MQKTRIYDVIILGAGAAGLFCALTAAQRQKNVLLIDHNAQAGRKISISGGGKANFTNLHMDTSFYVGNDTDFAEPALQNFPPEKIMQYFKKHNFTWEERSHGQLFGKMSAQELVNALVQDCQKLNCCFAMSHTIKAVKNENDFFNVICQEQERVKSFFGHKLVLAMGSPAWEKVGSSATGVKFARQFGHKSIPFTPVLASLYMPSDWFLNSLSGISLPVCIKVEDFSCTDALLFTHKGISGPAVLRASCYWREGMPVNLNFLPNISFIDILDSKEYGKIFVRNALLKHLPQRLTDKLLPKDWAKRKIAELPRKIREILNNCVHNFNIYPEKKASMQKAEAAAGGIITNDINPWSMESLLQKDVYIVGEMLDITGQLGGYNLHWAWASGFMAGQNI